MRRTFMLVVLLALFPASATGVVSAHEVRPAYLQLIETGQDTYDVLWKVPGIGDNLRLGLYVQLPAECINLTEPRGLFAAGSFTERWSVKCSGGLTGGTIHIAGLSSTMTDVLVRHERLDGSTQVIRLTPSAPAFVVEASPGMMQVAATFLRLGFEHILLGVDHLLFVLGLLLIVSARCALLKTITAFTVAHSLTLGIATLGYAGAPGPPVEAAIALSILFLGPEIVRVERGETSLTIRYPWVVAFAFGLLHGFGFASGLSTAGMAPAAIPQALLWFNVGVELGQLAFVGFMLALARSLRVVEMRWPVWVARAPGYVVGACGAFWTIQRTVMMLTGR